MVKKGINSDMANDRKDTYTSWSPIRGLVGEVRIEKLEDTDAGLTIYLKISSGPAGHERRAMIRFDPYVAYRNMDESYRARTFNDTGGLEGSLYIVNSSSWLNWLNEESVGFYRDSEIVHYSIFTEADCIDILAEFSPEFSWLKEQEKETNEVSRANMKRS